MTASPSSSTGTVLIERPSDHVAVVTIDHPPLNTFDRTTTREVLEVLDQLEADPAVRCLVLTGRGRAFCCGADLAEQQVSDQAERLAYVDSPEQMSRVLERLGSLRFPVIAAVNGFAMGGGCELALSCDVRVASSEASFTCSGVNVGLIVSWHTLPRIVGLGRAQHLLLSGERWSAQQALEWGAVTALYEPAELLAGALKLAERIASRAPLSVAATRSAARRAFHISEFEAIAEQRRLFIELGNTGDHAEAIDAFLAKREPQFKGQ